MRAVVLLLAVLATGCANRQRLKPFQATVPPQRPQEVWRTEPSWWLATGWPRISGFNARETMSCETVSEPQHLQLWGFTEARFASDGAIFVGDAPARLLVGDAPTDSFTNVEWEADPSSIAGRLRWNKQNGATVYLRIDRWALRHVAAQKGVLFLWTPKRQTKVEIRLPTNAYELATGRTTQTTWERDVLLRGAAELGQFAASELQLELRESSNRNTHDNRGAR